MPVLNGECTIAGAINSIISQSFKNWELIIVDDGSTDKTQEVVGQFSDRRIKFFEQEHRGVASTRNFGNSKASGIYCIVQDADDFSMPDRLEKVVSSFRETNVDVIVHGLYINVWNDQFKCMERQYKKPELDALNNKINGVPAYKKSVWIAKPFREETRYAYDFMMNLDWMLSGFKYHALDQGLYEYVRYQGSASDRFEKSGKRAEAFKIIKQIVKKEYNKNISSPASPK